jgi:hypothetical protein
MGKSQAATGRKILQSKKLYPAFNAMDYDLSLARNLTFYSTEIDNAFKKAVAIEYWKILGKNVKPLTKLNDGWFATCGAVAHMHKDRDIQLEARHLLYMENTYKYLASIKEDAEKEEEIVPIGPQKLTMEQKDSISLSTHIGEFEAGVDLIYAGKPFDSKSYLLTNNVKSTVAKQIGQHFKSVLRELKDIDSDEVLQEAYDAYSKRELRIMREAIANMISTCDIVSAISKAKKPSIRKDKPPSVLAKDVKYLREYLPLKLRSITPDKIVNSTEVWIFNIKVRRLFKYEALDGMKLSVKGTTILNFDPSKSGGKIIRKPEQSLKDIDNMTTRPLNKLFSGIRAVASKALGRINEDSIILKAF